MGTSDTDASLYIGIKSFVLVAVRLEIGNDTFSGAIGGVSEVAFTGNTVITLVGSAELASSVDKEVTLVAIALTVFFISIFSTILIS